MNLNVQTTANDKMKQTAASSSPHQVLGQ